MGIWRILSGAAIVAIALAVMASGVQAEIPRKINYQARLTDSPTGEPLVGSLNLTFRIYDDPLSGSPIWEEGQTLAADSVGVVSAILGSIVPIEIDLGDASWLEVEVEGEVLSPRREIVSVPYAFHALDSESLGGYEPSDFVVKGEEGSITVEMIVGGTGSGLNADMLDSLHAEAFSDTGHVHDERYYRREELNTSGTINDSQNPVAWTKLKGVPAGFADGTDDAGGAGDGHSLDAADGSPVDAVYVDNAGRVGIATSSPGTTLDVTGDINASSHYLIGGERVLSNQVDSLLFVGIGAGGNHTGSDVVFIGDSAGYHNQAYWNTFIGRKAGYHNTTGGSNTFLGHYAAHGNTTGHYNTYIGRRAAAEASAGNSNTYVGALAGHLADGSYNTFIGMSAGFSADGNANTALGQYAGASNETGQGNVFIGYRAGYYEMGSNKFYLANGSDNSDVLIHGDFSTGKIGFGLVDPEYTYEFASYDNKVFKVGSGGAWIRMHIGGNSRMGFGDGDDNEAGYIYGGENASGENILGLAACWDVGGCLRGLILHESGNMGLGTDDPDWDFHIVGGNPRLLIEASKSNPEVNFRSSDDAYGDTWAVYKDSTTNDLRFYQSSDKVIFEGGTGNVGIGTDPGGYKLRVNGTACGTSPWAVCSDRRFKDNIATVGNALGKVLSLRGVTFDWKTGEYPDKNFDEGAHYGCIAQEVEAILPEVVREGPDGDKAVAYAEIVPVLIESIKAQQIQIEGLRADVEELRSALAAKD